MERIKVGEITARRALGVWWVRSDVRGHRAWVVCSDIATVESFAKGVQGRCVVSLGGYRRSRGRVAFRLDEAR